MNPKREERRANEVPQQTQEEGQMYLKNSGEPGQEIVVDLPYIHPESQSSTDELVRELQNRQQQIGEALQPETAREAISVAELARQIGRSEHVTYKLLDRGEIPGAKRKTPDLPNSPWVIWADAGSAFLQKENRRRSK